jgi:hypothetical protein
MQIPNTLFRVGGAAIILTNKFSERHRAKYELEHVVRVHLGSDDMAYQCACLAPHRVSGSDTTTYQSVIDFFRLDSALKCSVPLTLLVFTALRGWFLDELCS